jgi:predicted RNase H-like HicB family nuclease
VTAMKYLVEVLWSDYEGSIAIVPDLLGCSAFGMTPQKAVATKTRQGTYRPTRSC